MIEEVIFNTEDDVTVPSGRVIKNEELRKDTFFKRLFEKTCVAVYEDGVMKQFYPLEDFKSQYGVTEDDSEKALEMCLAAREQREQEFIANSVFPSDIQAQLDALAGIA